MAPPPTRSRTGTDAPALAAMGVLPALVPAAPYAGVAPCQLTRPGPLSGLLGVPDAPQALRAGGSSAALAAPEVAGPLASWRRGSRCLVAGRSHRRRHHHRSPPGGSLVQHRRRRLPYQQWPPSLPLPRSSVGRAVRTPGRTGRQRPGGNGAATAGAARPLRQQAPAPVRRCTATRGLGCSPCPNMSRSRTPLVSPGQAHRQHTQVSHRHHVDTACQPCRSAPTDRHHPWVSAWYTQRRCRWRASGRRHGSRGQ